MLCTRPECGLLGYSANLFSLSFHFIEYSSDPSKTKILSSLQKNYPNYDHKSTFELCPTYYMYVVCTVIVKRPLQAKCDSGWHHKILTPVALASNQHLLQGYASPSISMCTCFRHKHS